MASEEARSDDRKQNGTGDNLSASSKAWKQKAKKLFKLAEENRVSKFGEILNSLDSEQRTFVLFDYESYSQQQSDTLVGIIALCARLNGVELIKMIFKSINIVSQGVGDIVKFTKILLENGSFDTGRKKNGFWLLQMVFFIALKCYCKQ